MKILVIGGTGFLGYHIVNHLLAEGHSVSILALPGSNCDGLFQGEVTMVWQDICQASPSQLVSLLRPFQGFVFAAGADDRCIPFAPAYPFFYQANVRSVVLLCSAAREAGLQKGIILGSYFSYFDRVWPHLQLAKHHPYILSRREQGEMALAAAGDSLDINILELPYVFGSMPGKEPLWSPLINYIRSDFPLFYPRGGTNMIAVQHVAEAVSGALQRGEAGKRYVVGDKNISWRDLLDELCDLCGRQDRRVREVPEYLVSQFGLLWGFSHWLRRKESGLRPDKFAKLQCSYTYFDAEPSRRQLGYGSGGLQQAWQETVTASPASPLSQFTAKTMSLLRTQYPSITVKHRHKQT